MSPRSRGEIKAPTRLSVAFRSRLDDNATVQATSGTQIIGHRGAAGHAPENSEAALSAGIRLGATAVEVDVQFTADDVPIVFHDRTLERMAGVKGKIRDNTARELSGYDIGFRFGDEHRGQHILTLEEAAAIVPPGVQIHVEVKDYDPVSAAQLKEMIAILRKRGGIDRCVISSFSEKILGALRTVEGRARRGLLVAGPGKSAPQHASEIGCTSLHPEAGHVTAALVDACKGLDLAVFPYTVNDADQMKHLIAMGVDGIYTDFPGRFAELATRPARPARPAKPPRAHREPPRVREKPAERIVPVEIAAEPEVEIEEEPVLFVVPETEAEAEIEAERAEGASGERRGKRHRGKRGGRRHRRVAEEKQPPKGGPPAASVRGRAASVAQPAPAARQEKAGRGESLSEAKESGEPAASLEPAAEKGKAASPGEPTHKKRRRGRRGGRRERERRMRKERVAGSAPAGSGPTDEEPPEEPA